MKKKIILLFALLQLSLFAAWFTGSKLHIFEESPFIGSGLRDYDHNSLVWSRANFDGVHFVQIARDGYGYLQEAFFPFFPKLIGFFQPLFKSYLLSGIFVANLSFIFVLVVFWRLLEEEKIKKSVIKDSLVFLTFFPTAFYFLSVYSESTFLLLVLLSLYFARRGKFLWAGLVAGLASYTRFVGIFLLPALLVEYYEQASARKMKDRLASLGENIFHFSRKSILYWLKTRTTHFKNLFYIGLSSTGLLAYMIYLHNCCGDWLYFAKVQVGFGGQRVVNKLILLYQVFWRYAKMVVTVAPRQWLYFCVWFELVIVVFILVLLLWGWHKRKEYKIRLSWLVFSSLAFILPTFTGTFSSMPRYVLVSFPAFVVLARFIAEKDKNSKIPWLKIIYLTISFILLMISATAFFKGGWIA